MAAAVLLLQVVALILALTLPAFRVRSVSVSGERLLGRQLVLQTAAVPAGSVFTVDGDAVRARVMRLAWVRDATVTTELPGGVRIVVDERAPLLRLRRGGRDTLLADNGATLRWRGPPPRALRSLPVLLDERIGTPEPVDPALLRILSVAAARFQPVFGCPIAGFEWGADDVLAVWSATGWRAVLGHIDTDAAVAGVPAQLAALAALKGRLDFTRPAFGYVDLENAEAPAVGGTPGLPQQMQTARFWAVAAATAPPGVVAPPVATASPTATPTLMPSPTTVGSTPSPTAVSPPPPPSP
jgi:hypothetical protein